MIVYHGTILSCAKEIFRENILSVTTDKNTHYKENTGIYKTKRGYVYLTSSLKCAFEFGAKHILNDNFFKTRNGMSKKESVIVIFKFDINQNELELDKDEIELESCDYNEGAFFYKLKRNINIKNELLEYMFYKFKDYDSVYRLLENDNNLSRIKWYKLEHNKILQ